MKKIRLIEECDVEYNSTRYRIERQDNAWPWSGWELMNSYSTRDSAQQVFDRYKASKGVRLVRKTLEESIF